MQPQTKKPNKAFTVAIIVMTIFVCISLFVLGTMVGFNEAIHRIGECHEVPCDSLGINATSCDVCPGGITGAG